MLRRTIAALVIGSLSMLTPTASAAPPRSTLTALPGNEVFPESIAVDQRTGVYYVGSVKDGTLFRGRVGSPEVTVFSPAGADGRTIANGLALDGDRLIVLGRQTGKVHVYDTRTARLVTTLHNGEPSTFLNDLTVHPAAATTSPTRSTRGCTGSSAPGTATGWRSSSTSPAPRSPTPPARARPGSTSTASCPLRTVGT